MPSVLGEALPRPTAVVVCGPSGVGKTTVGTMLAQALRVAFVEGDDLHSEASIAKMRSGTPLTDEDRAPWLARLRKEGIEDYLYNRRQSVVIACSALKRVYRDVLRGGGDGNDTRGGQVFFVLLSGEAKLISDRLRARGGHFMPPSLLASQLAILEPLDNRQERGMTVSLAQSPSDMVAQIVRRLTDSSAL